MEQKTFQEKNRKEDGNDDEKEIEVKGNNLLTTTTTTTKKGNNRIPIVISKSPEEGEEEEETLKRLVSIGFGMKGRFCDDDDYTSSCEDDDDDDDDDDEEEEGEKDRIEVEEEQKRSRRMKHQRSAPRMHKDIPNNERRKRRQSPRRRKLEEKYSKKKYESSEIVDKEGHLRVKSRRPRSRSNPTPSSPEETIKKKNVPTENVLPKGRPRASSLLDKPISHLSLDSFSEENIFNLDWHKKTPWVDESSSSSPSPSDKTSPRLDDDDEGEAHWKHQDGLDRYYVYGNTISTEEDSQHEFKWVKSEKKPVDRISSYIPKYVNAFLNSNGGVMYFGVRDDGVILGIALNRKQRDELRLRIDNIINTMFTPQVDPYLLRLEFIRVLRFKSRHSSKQKKKYKKNIKSRGYKKGGRERGDLDIDLDRDMYHSRKDFVRRELSMEKSTSLYVVELHISRGRAPVYLVHHPRRKYREPDEYSTEKKNTSKHSPSHDGDDDSGGMSKGTSSSHAKGKWKGRGKGRGKGKGKGIGKGRNESMEDENDNNNNNNNNNKRVAYIRREGSVHVMSSGMVLERMNMGRPLTSPRAPTTVATPRVFIGREEEIARIRNFVIEGFGERVLMVVLYGLPVVGKSSLARKLMVELSNTTQYPDAYTVIDMKGTSTHYIDTEEAMVGVIRMTYPSLSLAHTLRSSHTDPRIKTNSDDGEQRKQGYEEDKKEAEEEDQSPRKKEISSGEEEEEEEVEERKGGVVASLNNSMKRISSELKGLYESCFRGKSCVLLIENVGSTSQVQSLIPLQAKSVLVLVTSRKNLTLKEDSTCLDGNCLFVKLSALSVSDGARLLQSIAKSTSDEHAAVIAQLCGYLPLPLKIVGSTLKKQAEAGIPFPARNMIARLTREEERVHLIEYSFIAVIEGETEEMKINLLALSLFLGTFDGRAAAHVLGKVYYKAMDVLGYLVDSGWIEYIPSHACYVQNDLIKLYFGKERRKDAGLDTVFKARFISYYLHYLKCIYHIIVQAHRNENKGVRKGAQEEEEGERIVFIGHNNNNNNNSTNKASIMGYEPIIPTTTTTTTSSTITSTPITTTIPATTIAEITTMQSCFDDRFNTKERGRETTLHAWRLLLVDKHNFEACLLFAADLGKEENRRTVAELNRIIIDLLGFWDTSAAEKWGAVLRPLMEDHLLRTLNPTNNSFTPVPSPIPTPTTYRRRRPPPH